MNFLFTREVISDLSDVDRIFKQSLLPWWDDISLYHDKLQEDFTWKVLPAVVLNIYKYFGLNRKISIAMANIFKNVYFSNYIHALIKDDEEGQQHDNKMQFTILIGDYIFGNILKLLVESNTVNLLDIFSELMSELSEGMILQYKLQAEPSQVFKKAKAPLYETVFYTAAQLSGLNGENKEVYKRMGYNLGMSVELYNQSGFGQEAQRYVYNMEQILKKFKDYYNTPDSILEKVIKNLHASIYDRESIAVVI